MSSGFINPFPLSGLVGGYGLRNRIVNGDMRIDQMTAGVASPINSATGIGGYQCAADKFKFIGTAAAGVFNAQQLSATPPTGFQNYIRCTVATPDAAPAAGSTYGITTHMEGYSVVDIAFGAAGALAVTLGKWVRCSIVGTFSATLRNAAQDRSQTVQFTIAAANTWQFVALTFVGDVAGTWLKTNGIGMSVVWNLGCGATYQTATLGAWNAGNFLGCTTDTKFIATNGATFDLTGVQIEPGGVPTAFEQRPIGDALRLCQREFSKSFNIGTAPAQNAGANTGEVTLMAGKAGAATNYLQAAFEVRMRAAPTVTIYNPAAANSQVRDVNGAADCSATAIAGVTERHVLVQTTGAAGTLVGSPLQFHYSADARL